MPQTPIRVLIVEDDPMIAELHRRFVQAVDGFTVVGDARDGQDACDKILALHPHLVILDIFMPEIDGLHLLKQLRSDELACDVIMVTAAHDAKAVTEAMRLGVVDYIVKPFRFERLKQALEAYRQRRRQLITSETVNQQMIDNLLKRDLPRPQLTKGLHQHTLELVTRFLSERPAVALSADEVAQEVGISRATARRYLEHLSERGLVRQTMAYGTVGRPVNLFHWSGIQ